MYTMISIGEGAWFLLSGDKSVWPGQKTFVDSGSVLVWGVQCILGVIEGKNDEHL